MDLFHKVTLLTLVALSNTRAMPLQFPLLQPLPGTLQPLSGTLQPLPGTLQPLSGTLQPLPGTLQPLSGTLQPLSGTLQQQQLALQEQMLAIQQFQALRQFNAFPSPLAMNPQQPLLLLLPNEPLKINKDERYTNPNENYLTKSKPFEEEDNEDTDSISIDADTKTDETASDEVKTPVRAVLLVPNTARFSIGGIISNIPFLPIEINVPDSITWIYEGIAGIISGIGQSWPFNRPQTNQNLSTKSILKDLKTKKIMPIVVMPLGQPMLPMRF